VELRKKIINDIRYFNEVRTGIRSFKTGEGGEAEKEGEREE